MRTIHCKCGSLILLDDEDYEKLLPFAWQCNGKSVYFQQTRDNKHISVNIARFIISVSTNEVPEHVDRNYHNNQKYNLRVASLSQNAANRGVPSNSTTGYKYVTYQKRGGSKPYIAKVMKDGVRYTSTHATAEEAAKWGDRKALELFGGFAFTNFPKENYTLKI